MPFTVQGSPDGSASGAAGEESRGEVWAPVWTREFTLAEIRQLFAEARASWRGRPARRAVDFYAATRTLGVARGISEFTRYGLQRRNGLAFAAVPLDRVDVREHARGAAGRRRRGLGVPVQRERHLRGRRPGRAAASRRRTWSTPATAERCRWPGMLAALTALEQAVGRSGRARDASPVRYAPPARQFLDVLAASERPELRVAVGLASCATLPGPGQAGVPSRSMRQVLLPVDPPVPGDRSQPNGRWRDAPLVPGFGSRPLPLVLADVLIWRSRTAARRTRSGEVPRRPHVPLGHPRARRRPARLRPGRARREDPGPVPASVPGTELARRAARMAAEQAGDPGHHAGPAAPAGPRPAARRACERRHRLRRGRAGAGAEPGLGGPARRRAGQRGARRSSGPAAPGRLGRRARPARKGPAATVRRSPLPSCPAACAPAQC